MKVHLNTFASLVNRKSEGSLLNAILGIVEERRAPFWYSRIRNGVRRFFAENLNYGILASLITKLEGVVPETPFQKNDCANSKLAVEKMMHMSFARFDGKHLCKPAENSILFHGIELDVRPDALLFWGDGEGYKHVGAIKTKLKKTLLRQEEAVMIACLLKHYLMTLFPDHIVEDGYCICYDVFRSKFYGPLQYEKNLALAISYARRIAIMDHHAA